MAYKGWLAVFAMLFVVQTQAVTVDFDLIDPISADRARGDYARAFNYEVDGINLSISGLSSGGDRFAPFSSFSRARVGLWNGLVGIERRGLSHTIDNFGFDYDFLVLDFDTEVSLESIDLGYIAADSDVSIGGISNGSFVFGDSIFDASLGTNHVDSAGVVASRWLVGAFHPLFGAAQDSYGDSFKISQLSVNVNPVPLPAAFWFFATGLIAFLGLRRRAKI
ncbi:VPLPA-CTERM sorting domain-containing protein [Agarilytica rhodophyticola]|uniref:VPLPA-CTERM sorting domain-containing protein n=1 Tax=Agarilytica rhodophyticola TaxID=1737490 RepID=UPI000B34895F|nr:VPLPA-CTERM sorting domain-containing protein [Agarilytica rhodophyticola]